MIDRKELIEWATAHYDGDGPAYCKPYWQEIIRILRTPRVVKAYHDFQAGAAWQAAQPVQVDEEGAVAVLDKEFDCDLGFNRDFFRRAFRALAEAGYLSKQPVTVREDDVERAYQAVVDDGCGISSAVLRRIVRVALTAIQKDASHD